MLLIIKFNITILSLDKPAISVTVWDIKSKFHLQTNTPILTFPMVKYTIKRALWDFPRFQRPFCEKIQIRTSGTVTHMSIEKIKYDNAILPWPESGATYQRAGQDSRSSCSSCPSQWLPGHHWLPTGQLGVASSSVHGPRHRSQSEADQHTALTASVWWTTRCTTMHHPWSSVMDAPASGPSIQQQQTVVWTQCTAMFQ